MDQDQSGLASMFLVRASCSNPLYAVVVPNPKAQGSASHAKANLRQRLGPTAILPCRAKTGMSGDGSTDETEAPYQAGGTSCSITGRSVPAVSSSVASVMGNPNRRGP